MPMVDMLCQSLQPQRRLDRFPDSEFAGRHLGVSMFTLEFSGWFQCRLATDPDAFDDPLGQGGWTFAMPGEPDLDRLIRFHDPVAPRSHGPLVGVTVRMVRVGGTPTPGHPLTGTAVRFADTALFDGRNGEIATAAQEPIIPFRVSVEEAGVRVIGFDPIDLSSPAEIARRQPIDFEGNSAEVRLATGIPNAGTYRQTRRSQLQSDLASENDPVRQAALQKRIAELGQSGIRLSSLGFKLSYQFALRGPNLWEDPNQLLGSASANPAWEVNFWMGGWDADALSAFVHGTLSVT